MGYHVTITRERNGVESPISLEDWFDHIRSSPELKLDMPEGDDSNSKFIRSNHVASWSGRDDAWIGWSNGEIWTKNPPEELISYMIEVAPKFAARVRGGDGEYYRSLEDYYYEEDDRQVSRADYEQRMRDNWKHRQRWSIVVNCVRFSFLAFVIFLVIRAYLSRHQ